MPSNGALGSLSDLSTLSGFLKSRGPSEYSLCRSDVLVWWVRDYPHKC
jgi:hypothetical protein